jgi:hypothetical protein
MFEKKIVNVLFTEVFTLIEFNCIEKKIFINSNRYEFLHFSRRYEFFYFSSRYEFFHFSHKSSYDQMTLNDEKNVKCHHFKTIE